MIEYHYLAGNTEIYKTHHWLEDRHIKHTIITSVAPSVLFQDREREDGPGGLRLAVVGDTIAYNTVTHSRWTEGL